MPITIYTSAWSIVRPIDGVYIYIFPWSSSLGNLHTGGMDTHMISADWINSQFIN